MDDIIDIDIDEDEDPTVMRPLPFRPRLGTDPPPMRELGLSVPLDKPFHELKAFLLNEFEKAYVERMLEESAMNISRASRTSGLSRKHIRTLMAKYGLYVRRELAK